MGRIQPMDLPELKLERVEKAPVLFEHADALCENEHAMPISGTPSTEDQPIIFLHGLVSSGRGFKGTLFRRVLPGIITPDFTGPLEDRMAQLAPLLADRSGWTIIGSSFGGLMATLYARDNPERVRKLVLLAPALASSELPFDPNPPLAVPTVVFHGKHDTVIPLDPLRVICEQVFENLVFNVVDDDHRLQRTVQKLDWPALAST